MVKQKDVTSLVRLIIDAHTQSIQYAEDAERHKNMGKWGLAKSLNQLAASRKEAVKSYMQRLHSIANHKVKKVRFSYGSNVFEATFLNLSDKDIKSYLDVVMLLKFKNTENKVEILEIEESSTQIKRIATI